MTISPEERSEMFAEMRAFAEEAAEDGGAIPLASEEVLMLLDTITRLQRELTEAQEDKERLKLWHEQIASQLASAVARIAELSAENGRLFRERNEAQEAAAQQVADLKELRDWTPGRRTKSRVPAIAEDPVREETNG